ncbi:MAG: ADP-ribosyl-[dinitrogen reductase] hydrolase [Sterolibacteriaceae bacterium]|jgi:ADP-ribosyl-[dinitrogen reductase] hydrolase|uniref:ADP-ribosyl-[dinitrogen reductase] hydrolase n=1 Tax=Candidatus Methylophosphatis roskildensis TaxID=2899263 RepID=A0A9D7E574_9PROT|nr:ADP-ribosyl-[dinitrogen reductase] hydrolase [Candidatus Methylophosphatis roskildensis]MBK7236968.1 ADP-ribosyl-[dinitrogen reductase] hydrolase [Sterolibacteriaceae bacterium]MBK7665712.1 ADP-ribosyl-[dinitrogen reductase] hydrolase [Sterolibacteriaceae bacterium]MBK9085952.1 ADP-ribosyl-[dinitrogen reductase] hydrolase [Sterolibacteriaceae bacterium]
MSESDSQRTTNRAWNERALEDRALGAYLGLAIGDALGATVEFMTPGEIARQYGTHDRMVGGGWLKLKPGQVTDDTSMSLALGDAIVERNGFDTRAVAESFARWLRSRPIDVGNTCRRGIQRYITQRTLAGPRSEGDAGNGACMRNLPVALLSLDDDAAFESNSIAQARITHNHPLSDAATLSLGRMVRELVRTGNMPSCRSEAEALVCAHRQFRFNPYPGRASGFIVDTVQTVLHAFFSHDDFEHCLIATVNRGDDADTTGALAGMLAGARCGALQLPARWLDRLDRAVVRRITHQTAALLALAPAKMQRVCTRWTEDWTRRPAF